CRLHPLSYREAALRRYRVAAEMGCRKDACGANWQSRLLSRHRLAHPPRPQALPLPSRPAPDGGGDCLGQCFLCSLHLRFVSASRLVAALITAPAVIHRRTLELIYLRADVYQSLPRGGWWG